MHGPLLKKVRWKARRSPVRRLEKHTAIGEVGRFGHCPDLVHPGGLRDIHYPLPLSILAGRFGPESSTCLEELCIEY